MGFLLSGRDGCRLPVRMSPGPPLDYPFTPVSRFLGCYLAKHIQLNDSPERFLVDSGGYRQADAFRRYDGLYLAPQCSQESLSTSSTRRRKTVSSGQAGRMAISPCLGTCFPHPTWSAAPFGLLPSRCLRTRDADFRVTEDGVREGLVGHDTRDRQRPDQGQCGGYRPPSRLVRRTCIKPVSEGID